VGFLSGVGALIAIEAIRTILLVEKVYKQYEAVSSLLVELRAPDKFSELLLLYGLKDLGNLSRFFISVGKDEVRNFWRDCIARASIKWSVLTYARPDETWGLTSWGEEALAIQRERIVSGCTIERVFIVEDEDEKNKLYEIMKRHSLQGINVFWLLKSDLLANETAAAYCNEIGTLDFAVVDDSWVYRTLFDRQRTIVGANATKSEEMCKKAAWLIRQAQGLARGKKNVVQAALGGEAAANGEPKRLAVSTIKLDGQSGVVIPPGAAGMRLVISGENLKGASITSSDECIRLQATSNDDDHVIETLVSISPDASPGDYTLNTAAPGGSAQINLKVMHEDAPSNLALSYDTTNSDNPPKLSPDKTEAVPITITGRFLKGAKIEVTIPGGPRINVRDNSNDNRLTAVVTVEAGTPAGVYELRIANSSNKSAPVLFKFVR
jgi:hypothetical protein